MYIIQYLNAGVYSCDRRRQHAYFIGFHMGKFRSYGAKAKAMKFETREEAKTFLRDVLRDREDHRVIKYK